MAREVEKSALEKLMELIVTVKVDEQKMDDK